MLRLSLVLSLLSSMSCLLSAQTRELTQSNLLDPASSSAVFLTGNEAVLVLPNEGVDPAEG